MMHRAIIFICLFFNTATISFTQTGDTLQPGWTSTLHSNDRAQCITIHTTELIQSGAYSNGIGTPGACFYGENTCGLTGVLSTVNVVDWLTIISESGDTSRRIGVGGTGLGVGQVFINIQPGQKQSYSYSGAALAFIGPINVMITRDSITVTRPANIHYGDDGDMAFHVRIPNPYIHITSNRITDTVWKILIRPDHYCPNFKAVQLKVLCPGDPLLLMNPCPDPDLWVIWEMPNGNTVSDEDTIIINNPDVGTYLWETPCQSGKIITLDPDNISISVTPIYCSNKWKVALPDGISALWNTGVIGNFIEVVSGNFWATLESTCGVFHTDTVSLNEQFHSFDLQTRMHPDTDKVLLTPYLEIWATSNADTLGLVTWQWQRDGQTIEPYLLGGGFYQITAMLGECRSSVSIMVFNEPVPYCDFPVYTPNIFTPNDDGVNDEFYLTPIEEGFVRLLIIFDRWGNQIYRDGSSDSNPSWNGTYHGEPLSPAVFVWFAEVVYGYKVCSLKGDVTIIR